MISATRALFLSSLLYGLISSLITFCFSAPVFAFGETPSANSQSAADKNPLTASARLQPSTLNAGGTAELIIEMQLAANFHAYLDRFKLSVEAPDDLKLDQFKITPTVQFMDTVSKGMKEGVENKATLHAVIEVPSGFLAGTYKGKVKLTFQACTTDHCLFPKSLILDIPFQVTSGGKLSGLKPSDSAPSIVTAPSSGVSDFHSALQKGTLSAILLMFVMGFLTSLTPCVYPMIPITLAVLGARAKDRSHLHNFSIALVYVLGLSVTYSTLGVLAAVTGSLFGSALSNIWVVSGLAILFIVMALSMYGLFEIQAPAFIRDRLGAGQTKSGHLGAFVTGLIAGFVASPCVGPVLVSVLTYIAQTQNRLLGFLLLFSFSIGMGILFIILGLSSSLIGKIPRAGRWMEAVTFSFGTLMVGMAFYYVHPLYPAWLFHVLLGIAIVIITSVFGAFLPSADLSAVDRVRKGLMIMAFMVGVSFAVSGLISRFVPIGSLIASLGAVASQTSTDKGDNFPMLAWKPFSTEALNAAVKSGQPVIIDFRADWCAACGELDKYTFTDPNVRDLSAKFALLRVDATEDFPGLDALKTKYTIVGLPTIVFYDRKGTVHPELAVIGFEEAPEFLKKMNSVNGAN